MERRAVPGELSGRRGVATLVRSFPAAVAFPFIAASLRQVWTYATISLTTSAKPVGAWGYVSAVDFEGRTIWTVDAHRDGKRYVVHADEKLTAFVELESAIRSSNGHDRAAVPV